MYVLKLIFMTIFQLIKQVWLLPQTIANAVQQDGGKWFETNLKPNGSTGYATPQSIWGSDWKFDLRERVEKPVLI